MKKVNIGSSSRPSPRVKLCTRIRHASYLIAIFSFAAIGYGAYSVAGNISQVQASVPEYEKVSGKYRHVFNQATRQYFDKTEAFQKADCKPEKVKIKYYRSSKVSEKHPGKNAYAYAYLWGAYKTNITPKSPPSVFKKEERRAKNEYCTIYFNRDAPQNIALQCTTFMHEYGHLIGRAHTPSDPNSVMYNGYANDKLLGKGERADMNTNSDNVSAKTVCPSIAELEAAAKPKKQPKPKKKKLTSGQIKGLCEEVVNNNYNKERGWRSRACRDGAKIGIKDWNANKKTSGACYKKGRDKKVEDVCNFGRTKAIDRMNSEHGYRPVP